MKIKSQKQSRRYKPNENKPYFRKPRITSTLNRIKTSASSTYVCRKRIKRLEELLVHKDFMYFSFKYSFMVKIMLSNIHTSTFLLFHINPVK